VVDERTDPIVLDQQWLDNTAMVSVGMGRRWGFLVCVLKALSPAFEERASLGRVEVVVGDIYRARNGNDDALIRAGNRWWLRI
jgi:hypothetical protein